MILTRLPLYSRTEVRFRVRLACVRHAASVDSEPGSNSQVEKRAPTAALTGGARQTSNTKADGSCVVQRFCQADTRTLFASTSYPVFKEPAPATAPQRHTTHDASPQGEPLIVQIRGMPVNIATRGCAPNPRQALAGAPPPRAALAGARRAGLGDDACRARRPLHRPQHRGGIRRAQG